LEEEEGGEGGSELKKKNRGRGTGFTGDRVWGDAGGIAIGGEAEKEL